MDLLVGVVTVRRAKNGHSRQVPINSTVARVLVELGAARTPHSDPRESVFAGVAYRTVSRAFGAAVSRAHAALRDAGQDPSRLEGFTWHGLRHTFASRLAMAGVDPRTIQELGGWRTLALVMRYAHLSPTHLRAAVERLVVDSPGSRGAVALRQDFDAPARVEREPRVADA